MKVQMLIASHKQYKMPNNDEIYDPIFVGAASKHNVPDGFQSDDTGDNISSENSFISSKLTEFINFLAGNIDIGLIENSSNPNPSNIGIIN